MKKFQRGKKKQNNNEQVQNYIKGILFKLFN